MSTDLSLSLRCADGTEIASEWVYEGASAFEWLRDRSHWPLPMAPMEEWLFNHGSPGSDRAWEEADLIAPAMFYRFQLAGPYLYARMTMDPPERLGEMVPKYMAVGAKYDGNLGFWRQYCQPRIERTCKEIDALAPGADFQQVAELWFYGFYQTFTSLPMHGLATLQLTMMLQEAFGEEAGLLAFEVMQGGENATQDIDREIWELAELARSTPAVAAIIRDTEMGAMEKLRNEPAARSFMSAFDALINRHSRRSQGWMILEKTWGEYPEGALALVRAQLGADAVSPDELREITARRRKESTERVLAALPAEKHAEFRGIVDSLDGYVFVREGRAYWQLVICGQMRHFLLRVGADLVAKGRLDTAEDIFFLTPEQIADTSADLRGRVKAGRAQWERYRDLEPPPIIGTAGETAEAAAKMQAEFRGQPASRGEVTGTARVLASPDEGHRLQKGDILVCVMTTPAWTPLFAIAGGIITETGGALSHPAITAREYGIPAVVALNGATTAIKDGQTVSMDGAKGMVKIAG